MDTKRRVIDDIKCILDKKFQGEIGFINIEQKIEKELKFFDKVILSKIEKLKINLTEIVFSNLKHQINEQQNRIAGNKRNRYLPECDKRMIEIVSNSEIDNLEKLRNRYFNHNIEQEINIFQEIRNSWFNERIKEFNEDNEWKEDCIKYYKYFNENVKIIFKFVELWNYYIIYKLDQGLETNITKVRELYNKNGINIDADEQFSKYKLITSNDFENNPPQILDCRLKAIIILRNISNETIDLFKKIRDFIGSVSFQIDPFSVEKYDHFIKFSMEHLEMGKKFKLDNLDAIPLTKLYDDEYSNILWIKNYKNNIIFEELTSDLLIENDDIVTQVLHFEYMLFEEQYYITHMDHEYICYTLEQYEHKKQKNIYGHKKIKTFKIDNSKIPLILENGENIFYTMLELYFKNIGLIKEYFMEVLRNGTSHNKC